MAVIELSAGFIPGYASRIFEAGASNNTGALPAYTTLLHTGCTGGYGPTTMGSGAILYLMKGAIPTNFSTLTNTSSHTSSILCSFNTKLGYPFNIGDFTPTIVTNPTTITTNYRFASASGVATWFWFLQRQLGDAVGDNATWQTIPIQQFYGTVGINGSGCDLNIPDTNIVSGQAYRVYNLRLQLPTSWSY